MNATPSNLHDHPEGHHAARPSGSGEPPPASDAALKDPVCGMTVTAQSLHVLQHEGKPVYFCSAGCKAKFAADPAKYKKHGAPPTVPVVLAPGDPAQPALKGAIYTCPMHPEIRQDHPGNCPKCGMTLELEMPTLDEGEDPLSLIHI